MSTASELLPPHLRAQVCRLAELGRQMSVMATGYAKMSEWSGIEDTRTNTERNFLRNRANRLKRIVVQSAQTIESVTRGHLQAQFRISLAIARAERALAKQKEAT